MRLIPFLFAIAFLFACGEPADRPVADTPPELPAGAQAISLSGQALYPPALTPQAREEREANLAEARADYESDPSDADAIIWLGRRTAYLGAYQEAIAIFSEGIEKHPDDARMYRHRGHRYITARRFHDAIEDLARASQLISGGADEVEPDGLPNARNIPTSTLHSNIWYHLGLAYYLKGDPEQALHAYRECMKVSNNPDMLVATSHWLYMTLRLLEQDDEAAAVLEPIHADMDVIENDSYHHLLLMYKGELAPEVLLAEAGSDDSIENAAVAYGIGNWHVYNGEREAGERILGSIVEGSSWAAFGFIAAEADLARQSPSPSPSSSPSSSTVLEDGNGDGD
jgi:tetratricopeptide (TPR) repeat protein